MTWVKIDDGFPAHRKVRGLSDAAFRLHMTALCDCAAHLTDGAITAQAVRTLPGAPQGKRLARVIDDLVGAGLWEPDGTGWRLHDFLDWNPSASSVLANREAARERMHRVRSPSVRANTPRTPSEHPPNDARSSCDRATRVPSRPVPSRDPSNLEASSEDLSGGAHPAKSSHPPQPPPSVVPGKVPCPAGLRLTDDQRATLEVAGIPPWAVDAITVEVVAGYQGDPDDRRPVTAWRKCLSRAISGRWNDSRVRDELRAARQGASASAGDADPPPRYWRPPPGEGEGAVPCPPEIAERLRRAGYVGPLAPTGSDEA